MRVGRMESGDIKENSSSEEEDFMSDSLLSNLEKPQRSAETYSERRRREVNEAREKGKIQNRQEREKEARKMGLGRNLLQNVNQKEEANLKKRGVEDSESSSSNKALNMMLAMGYQQGRGLGREESTEKKSKDDKVKENNDKKKSKTFSNALIEPLEIDERWMGSKIRAGIGTFSAALSRDITQASFKEANAKLSTSIEEEFRQRTRDEHTIRHYEKLLVDARSTCEDLDEKLGIKVSFFLLLRLSIYIY